MEWMSEPLSVTFRNMGMNFGQTVIFFSEGNSLKKMRLHFDGDINVPNKVRKLGVFTFRAFHMEILQAKCDSYISYYHPIG